MAIRIVYYKSIFSDAGIIHTMPNDSTLEDIKKELGVSSIARIVQNDIETEAPDTTDGSELIIYETVQNKEVAEKTVTFVALAAVGAVAIIASPWVLVAIGITGAIYGIAKTVQAINSLNSMTAGVSKSGTKGSIETSQGITGATNSAASIGTPIPIILGTRKVSPLIVGTYWTQPTYAAGTDANSEDLGKDIYLHGLLVVGYGPLMLTDFRLGDMPLGRSLTRNSIHDELITVVKTPNNNLGAKDELIFHIKQEVGSMNPLTYTETVLEEPLDYEILWPKSLVTNENGTPEEQYKASAPVRLTERGVKRVSVTLSARGFINYNSNNNEQAATPDTFKLCYREVGSKPWIVIASKSTSSFRSSFYKKEIRIELQADYPGYTVGHEKAIEVTVLRSRPNNVDNDPTGHSYLDIWKWTAIRTILAEKPISDEMASKICRIAFRIKATEYIAGNLDAINMLASSILPVAGANNKWVFNPGGSSYPNWSVTANPASMYVATFMDKWCSSETYTKGATLYTGWQKLEQWQTDNVKLDWKGLADLSRWSNKDRTVSIQLVSSVQTKTVGKYAECNTVITSAIKLIELLSSVLDVARSTFVYKDGKYSLIHDARYDSPLYNNPMHGTVVEGVLNPRITEALSFTRAFEEIYDEAIISFTNSAGSYYKQMSVTVRNDYVNDSDYNKRKADGTLRVLRLSQDMITDVYQLKMWAKYAFATAHHRQIIATAVVGHVQYAYPIGARIRITHDVLLKGYISARITEVVLSPTDVTLSFDMPAEGQAPIGLLKLSCVIYITNGINTPQIITTNCIAVSPLSLGSGNIRFSTISVSRTAFPNGFPSVDCLISVGMGDTTSEDFLLIGKSVTEAHGATLSLIQMADNVHEVDTGVLSEYTFNVTQTQRAITDTIVSSVPADVSPPLTIGVLTSINSALDNITLGDSSQPPEDVPGIIAIAYQDYISIEISWTGTGLRNNIQYFSVEVFNGTSWTELILNSAYGRYTFDRGTDGYPEKTGAAYNALSKWKIRARAVNVYGQTSLGYGPSTAGASIDVTRYKTWIPTVPVISFLTAHENGLDYVIAQDTSSFYGSDIKYKLALNSTDRIITYSKEGTLLFNRLVDGYPETAAERAFNSITTGTALDDFTLIATCTTNESIGISSTVKKPSILGYKTWIPRTPLLNIAVAGRQANISIQPTNDYYGKIENHIQIRRDNLSLSPPEPIESSWFALGNSSLAYTDESAYKTGSPNGFSITPFDKYSQVLPLFNQTLELSQKTGYFYRVQAKQTQAGAGAIYTTAWTTEKVGIAEGTGVSDYIAGSVKKNAIGFHEVDADRIAIGTILAENINVTARNKINSWVYPADDAYGWTFAATAEVITEGNIRSLKMIAPSCSLLSDEFEVLPNELISFAFGIKASGYVSGAGVALGLTAGDTFKTYEWNTTFLTWSETPVVTTNALFIAEHKANSTVNFVTYILGSAVPIDKVPAPTGSGIIRCIQLSAGTVKTRIRANGTPSTGSTFYIRTPSALPIGASKVVADQIEVKDLSAISAKLGKMEGDDPTQYKLVLSPIGGGNADKEGTLLLGKESEEHIRRTWDGSKWQVSISSSRFVISSLESKIIGDFKIVKKEVGGSETELFFLNVAEGGSNHKLTVRAYTEIQTDSGLIVKTSAGVTTFQSYSTETIVNNKFYVQKEMTAYEDVTLGKALSVGTTLTVGSAKIMSAGSISGASISVSGRMQAVGLSTSWGMSAGVNTGAYNAVMGTTTGATWLLAGTSNNVFRAGIQVLDSGGTMRIYSSATEFITLTGTALSAGATTVTSLSAGAGTIQTTGNISSANFASFGSGNTKSGIDALINNTGGSNTANGYWALRLNTTGNFNTAIGWGSLYANIGGSVNTANGYKSLYSTTTGSQNTANGYQALLNNTTGGGNTASGFNTGSSVTTQRWTLCLGYSANIDTTVQGTVYKGDSQMNFNNHIRYFEFPAETTQATVYTTISPYLASNASYTGVMGCHHNEICSLMRNGTDYLDFRSGPLSIVLRVYRTNSDANDPLHQIGRRLRIAFVTSV